MEIELLPITLCFLALLLAIILLVYSSLRTRPSSSVRLPPGPRPLPIVGNLLQLGDKPHRSLARLAKAHGPLMTLRLGRLTSVVISSPDVAREALQKNDQAFRARPAPDAIRVHRYNEDSIVWQPVCQAWRSLRAVCSTSLLTPQKLDNSRALRQTKARELTAFLRARGTEGMPVDVGRAVFSTMLNMTANTLFSVDMVSLSSDSAQEFKDLMWSIMTVTGSPNLSDYFPLLRRVDLQGKRRSLARIFDKLYKHFDDMIDRRLKATAAEVPADGGGTNDFLDTLIRQQSLSRNVIRTLLLDVFVGGSETSSGTVEWAMAELLRRPGAMARARAELASAVGDEREVDESDVPRLPYLQAVVKETLRLHPPFPFLLPRRAEEAVELCGYTVPKDAYVQVNAWGIGRDAAVWPEPELFMPERFMTGDAADFRGRHMELIPFGVGSRMCLGLPLASRMVQLLLGTMLHAFEWRLPHGMEPSEVDMDDKFGVVLGKAVPLLAVPIPAAR